MATRMITLRLTMKDVGRLLGSLQKSEEWDEADAQSVEDHDGNPVATWEASHRNARRSQRANLRLQDKLRKQIRDQS